MADYDEFEGLDEGLDETSLYPENIAGPRSEAAAGLPALPILFASGTYHWRQSLKLPKVPLPIKPIEGRGEIEDNVADIEDDTAEAGIAGLPIAIVSEELRLDVDGRYPQMTASGTLQLGVRHRTHWIARLRRTGRSSWRGAIWYKEGATAAFPFTQVHIAVARSIFLHQRKATVKYTGNGQSRTRTFAFKSSYFRPVEIEYDREVGATPILEISTTAHPNRPASMPAETLSIEKVFRRAGFDAKRLSGISVINSDGPDPNTTWSDAEMHDAMQAYWSKFDNRPQWAMWVLFGRLHNMGTSLGGIMFDSIGPNHRQGTAIFTDSFIANPPAGDANPTAWIERMKFWTAIHEMGHSFNLAHSWQKHLGTPWIPLSSEPQARSFMNYPYFVTGGQSAFFADFEYRFSNQELVFMRHAPERFVQMGNADWFDHHGFQQEAALAQEQGLQLSIAVDRESPAYDFLEPVVLELRLTNTTNQPIVVPANVLKDFENMLVILKRQGNAARRWQPFAHYCLAAENQVLQPGETISDSLFVSAGVNGWDIAEPGVYTVQMAMEVAGRELVSNALRLKIRPEASYEEAKIAQDYFTEDTGRVLAFDGSRYLESGVEALQEIVAKLPESRAATHARIALALPLQRTYRLLDVKKLKGAEAEAKVFDLLKADEKRGRELCEKALKDSRAVETLGREDFRYYAQNYTKWLYDVVGDTESAKKVERDLLRSIDRRAA